MNNDIFKYLNANLLHKTFNETLTNNKKVINHILSYDL